MLYVLWDASALAKRYAPETGSDTVDALFAAIPVSQQAAVVIGYAEIYSILLRKHNRGDLDAAAFAIAKSSLRAEVVYNPDFTLLSIDDAAVFGGIDFMELYNINATDAAILALFLRFQQTVAASSGGTFLLATSDLRLLHAAQSEGLHTLNPETLPVGDLFTFLATL